MEKENIWCVQEKKNGKGKGGKHSEGNIWKKVIIWSVEEKKNREIKGTNNLEMMIQLYMMVILDHMMRKGGR